ncbi:hypothetical protein [Pectobacterium sp. B2J-2]|uniref:hypothetical protein n=1 Tax=Pectobacterium sp. B2J-2 TaxID=3385372 RepID=UPI0038FCCB32
MSECGTIKINFLSNYSANIPIAVNIHHVAFNAAVDINLLDKNLNATFGSATVSFDGISAENIRYHEENSNKLHNYKSGNALFLDNLTYQGLNVQLQLWPVADKTLSYIQIPILSFWLSTG